MCFMRINCNGIIGASMARERFRAFSGYENSGSQHDSMDWRAELKNQKRPLSRKER